MTPETVYKLIEEMGFCTTKKNSYSNEIDHAGSFPWTDDEDRYIMIKHVGADKNDLVFLIQIEDTTKESDFPKIVYQKHYNLNNERQHDEFFEVVRIFRAMLISNVDE